MLKPLKPQGSVTVEQRGSILIIGLDNPTKLNAFDPKMYHDLAAAYGELEADDRLRCGILFGNGDHFTSGLDLPEWMPLFEKKQFAQVPEGGLDPLGLQGTRISKPIIAAVHGWCLTIGIELVLACDIRIAAKNARFAQLEIKRGIYPVGGATVRLPREIGWGNAMRYLLTGDEFSGEEAYRMGLVQDLVEPGEQLERAIRIAETITHQAPLGVMASLKSARMAMEMDEEQACSRLLDDLQPLLATEDAAEGVKSFLERRQASFKGR